MSQISAEVVLPALCLETVWITLPLCSLQTHTQYCPSENPYSGYLNKLQSNMVKLFCRNEMEIVENLQIKN